MWPPWTRRRLRAVHVIFPNKWKVRRSWRPQLCGGVRGHLYPAVIHNQTPLCCYNGPDIPVLLQCLAACLVLQTGSVGGGWTPMLLCNLSRISIWPHTLTLDYSTSSRSCSDFQDAPHRRSPCCLAFEEKRGRIIHMAAVKQGQTGGQKKKKREKKVVCGSFNQCKYFL